MKSNLLLAPVVLALAVLSCGAAAAATAPSARAGAVVQIKGDIKFKASKPGVTPFIANAAFTGSTLAKVKTVSYTIAAQPGATAKPVKVQYSIAALQARGDAPPGGPLTLPIFGLYAGVTNAVTVSFGFEDGSNQVVPLSLVAAKYTDPNKIYDKPTILTKRTNAFLGFSYLYMKSGLGSPIVIDTDGAIRWVGQTVDTSFSSTFDNGVFMIGIHKSPGLYNMQLDGTFKEFPLDDPSIAWFNHNIVRGRDAYLTGVDWTDADGVINVQSKIAEMTMQGHVVREWDFAKIIADYMTANGDDASQFVHPGLNWLHINSSYYDPNDNSLVISSREQFVMKVDYDSGAIKWILGDPTKWWHSFASLRAKAITLQEGGYYPIGQHGINLEPNGTILLFNNGAPSYGMPDGEPMGESRTFSAINAYTIDPSTMTGTEVFRYTHNKTLKSNVCSSAWEEDGPSMILDYAAADDGHHTHIVALDASGNIALEYQYNNKNCGTAWHTVPISFENLTIN
jgi:arylsulfate sulfotransferase